jgi:hypothetical protein
MYTADALAEPIGSLAPPDSMRAGRNRTWSASDFPQLTQVGMRSSSCPLPSVTKTFAESTRVAQAAQQPVPRGLYRWHSTLSPPPGQTSTRASV